MSYVKGCSFIALSKYVMKKFDKEKITIAEELGGILSLAHLKELLDEACADFVNASGEVEKGRPAGQVFVLTKKIDKQKKVIGYAAIKRVPGEPSGRTGIAKWFEDSTDSYETVESAFAAGYEDEEKYFEEAMIGHFKDCVGLGQVKDAEYGDKVVSKLEKKKILGMTFTRIGFFLLMWFAWGIIFNNFGVGLCFAFIFTMSFITVTSKVNTKEEGKIEGAIEE